MSGVTESHRTPFDSITFYVSPILHSRQNVYDILPKSTFGTEHLPGVSIYKHRSRRADEFMCVCVCMCVRVGRCTHTHTHTPYCRS